MSAQKADEILDQKQKQQDQYAAKNWIGKIKEVVAHGGEMSLLDLQAAAAKGFTNHNIENISAQDRIQQLQEMIAHLQSGMLDQSLREKAIALEVETRLRYNIGEKAGYSLLPQDRTGDEVSIPHELILYRKALQEAGISAQEIHTYEKAEARDIEYRYTYAVADIKAYYDEAIATWAHRNALKAAAPGAMLGALAGGLIAYEMPDIHHISQQVAGSLHENFVQAQHSIVTTTNHTIENFLKQNSGTAHAATLDTHVSMNGLAHQHVLQTAHMDQETTRGILNHDLPPVQVESKDFDASWNDNATTHIGTITYEHGPVEQTLNNGIDDQGRFYIQGDPGANALVVNVPDNPGHINGPMVVELSNQHNLTFDVKNPADLASKVTILQNGVKHQITKAQLLQYMVAGNSPESYAKTVANYTKWYAHQVAIGGPTGSEYYYMENPTENNIFTANISTAYVAQHNGVMDIDYHATIQGHGLHPNHVQVPEVQPRVKDPLAEIKTDVQTNMGGRYTVEERGYEDIVSIDGKPSAVVQLVDPQMRDYKISWLDSQGQLHAEMLYDKTPLEVSQALSQDAIQNPDNVSHFMEVGDMGSHEILFVDTKYAIHPDTGIISNGVNPVGRASFNGDQMTITSLDGSHHVTIQGKDGTFALRDNDIAQLQLTTEPSPVPTQGPKPIETPTATVPGTTDSGGVNVGQAIANAQANVAVQAVEAGAGIIGSGVAGAVAVNKGMGAYRRRNPNLAPLPITVNVAPLPDRTNVHAVDAYLQTSLAPEPQDIPDRQQAMDDFEQQYVALQDVINLSSSPVQDVFTFIENNPQAFLGLTAIQSLPAVDTLINKLSSSLDEIEGARDEAVDIDRIIKSSGLSTILDANTDYRNYLHNLHYSVITANALQEEIVRDYLDPLISAVLAKNIIETWKSKHPLQPVTPIPPNNPVSPPAPPQPNINVPPITPLPRAPRPPVQPLRTRVQSAINRVDRAILDRRNRAAYKSTQELGLATTVNIGGNKPPLDLATYEPDPKFDGRLELVTMGSYEIGAGSDRGVDRRAKEDEDSFEIATIASVENGQPVEETLLILADGMGGQSFGKEASRLVVKHTREKYADIRKNQPQKTSADALTEAVLFANDMVYKENVKLGLIGPNQKPMGSTCVAAVMKKNGSYIIANVGDSRAYKVTSKKIEQLTDDQSVVASLVKAGSITPQDIYTHKRRNEIWGTMGNTTSIQVDISVSTENLKKGEQLVLCCDGLWEMTKDAYGGVIQKFARSTGNQKEVARRLIAKALLGDGLDSSGKPNKGGLDNITVISAMKVA
ncbi:MAG TPA: protein phosphatase 2C domain-containing protein [Candidatus Saccharimonadales bacterium]|nr:protein phosphatase 2C domain-containing protein [Candidatus Saccharimonadales bacterium]